MRGFARRSLFVNQVSRADRARGRRGSLGAPQAVDTQAGGRSGAALSATYALMGLLLIGYLVSLIIRTPDQSSQLLDGWLVSAFEIVASALYIARGFTRRSGRAVAVTLGLALLMWSLGDIALTIESQGGANPPTPSVADAFYLAFYPLAYVAIVLFMRGEVPGECRTRSWPWRQPGSMARKCSTSARRPFFGGGSQRIDGPAKVGRARIRAAGPSGSSGRMTLCWWPG